MRLPTWTICSARASSTPHERRHVRDLLDSDWQRAEHHVLIYDQNDRAVRLELVEHSMKPLESNGVVFALADVEPNEYVDLVVSVDALVTTLPPFVPRRCVSAYTLWTASSMPGSRPLRRSHTANQAR